MYKSTFTPYASVLSEGFTDRDATAPINRVVKVQEKHIKDSNKGIS